MKFLHQTLDWEEVQAVGFDLDGTLYNEYKFIEQVYRPIAKILAEATGMNDNRVYNSLLQRWLEKGSSYNRIFEDILVEDNVPVSERSVLVDECLFEFRNFQPVLDLPVRVEKILDWLSARFPLFLVTDGREKLQRAKLEALGLSRWISPDNTSISGSLGEGIMKPNADMSLPVQILKGCKRKPCSVVYFGDRDVDEAFARNCGYQFIRVNVMMPSA